MMQRSDVDGLFRYHAPTPETIGLHREVDDATRRLALQFYDALPACPERTLAIRALHEARYHANTAIAVHTPR